MGYGGDLNIAFKKKIMRKLSVTLNESPCAKVNKGNLYCASEAPWLKKSAGLAKNTRQTANQK